MNRPNPRPYPRGEPDPESDGLLVRQAKAGSHEALARLLERSNPAVKAYLAYQLGARLRRHTSLSDIHQDVLLHSADVLRVLPETATADDFQALLLRHARWAIGRAARRGREFAGESVAMPGQGVSDTPTPYASEGQVTRGDELGWLAAEVERLEEPLAAAVRLRLEGRTFSEIASALGIGEDAARKRLVRAALILRERRKGLGSA